MTYFAVVKLDMERPDTHARDLIEGMGDVIDELRQRGWSMDAIEREFESQIDLFREEDENPEVHATPRRPSVSEIWKFPMVGPYCEIRMPKGSEVLSVGAQGDDIVIWAECPIPAAAVTRRFAAFNTGVELPGRARLDERGIGEARKFVGTVQMPSGIVWHIFEVDL